MGAAKGASHGVAKGPLYKIIHVKMLFSDLIFS
ncbi:hypothetical protein ABID16_002481 [Rhizobium aquaticum]|uniref:Uncharacterized protein n=1 Tax=Rhizobium aquaticum TaxID=1549636 RepID=A0ABV2J078_9HYPH